MKKIVYLLVIITALASCGRDKKEEQTKQSESVVEKKADQYSVLIEAIYEKNDSISLVYQDGGFFQYEKAISSKITGQTGLQKIEIKIPENQQIENIKIVINGISTAAEREAYVGRLAVTIGRTTVTGCNILE